MAGPRGIGAGGSLAVEEVSEEDPPLEEKELQPLLGLVLVTHQEKGLQVRGLPLLPGWEGGGGSVHGPEWFLGTFGGGTTRPLMGTDNSEPCPSHFHRPT